MVKLLSTKAGKLSLGDALMIAVAKSVEERMLSPVIGNATFVSGGVKIGLGLVANKMVGGKIGDILGTAFFVDGTEDIVTRVLGGSSNIAPVGQGGSSVI